MNAMSNTNNIRQIDRSVDLSQKGLPASPDAERFLIGSMFLDDSRFDEISDLSTDDFCMERHRRIYACMRDLHSRGEHIDYITVAEEFTLRYGHQADNLSFLTSLTDGLPQVSHLDSYVRILRKKADLRRAISIATIITDSCQLENAPLSEILDTPLSQLEELRNDISRATRPIRRIEELESVFADRTDTEFLVKPELPVKAIVCLTGDSESGKTTLACALARDVHNRGHAVLILDRDKNPRDRICERLQRLGIPPDVERFHVWDCEQEEEPPQPNDPRIEEWVTRMMTATGKHPLVVVDSLISFLGDDEDENSAVDMRALFDRCRALTRLGATVIIIHHNNRNGDVRGSSDFRPASDQAFAVTNCDRRGGRLLDVITLSCQKSRYGLSECIEYHYAGGKMVRAEEQPPSKTANEVLGDLLRANPGILTEKFAELAIKEGILRQRAREFLTRGVKDGNIQVKREGRARHYSWVDSSVT